MAKIKEPFLKFYLTNPHSLLPERARKIQRFMSQPFAVATVFTGFEGKLVKLKDTVRSFKEILEGKHDALPESSFYMVSFFNEDYELKINCDD